MIQVQRALISEDEFLALPQNSEKTELLDGEVILAPAPSFGHQEILARLVHALRKWAAQQRDGVTVGQSPLDVRFARGRILQPDAFVLLRPTPLSHKGPIADIPELCIEVLSEDRIYDRITKRLIYGTAGVQEYWVVDPVGVVDRWTGPGLGLHEVLSERLTTPLLPGFELEVPSLFR